MTEPLVEDDLVPAGTPYSTGVVNEPVWLPKSTPLDAAVRWWRSIKLGFEAKPPPRVNWDDRQVVPIPGDQQETNSCICYASCLAAAALYQIKTGRAISLAPRVLHLCLVDYPLSVGMSSDLMVDAAVQFGLPNTVDPAEASSAAALKTKTQCSLFGSTPRLRVTGVSRFYSPDEAMAALRSTGPLVVHMKLTDHFRDHYVAGSVYVTPPGATTLTSHAVCLIGYDDSKGCWICVNSYGPNWRGTTDGRFMLKYGECGVLATGAAAYRLDIQV